MQNTEKRIVALISGSGSNLQALIDACASGQIDGQVVCVISNRASVYGLERATKRNIPTRLIDHTEFETREQFDDGLKQLIDSFEPDLVVLAGFMRILTEGFVQHYEGRLLNIHPSLLPKYKGVNTHQRALDDRATKHGASVHFVSPELDGGPVILQAAVHVKQGDDAQTLAKRVLTQEHTIYPQVVEWFCSERLSLKNGIVLFDGSELHQPISINAENHSQPISPS